MGSKGISISRLPRGSGLEMLSKKMEELTATGYTCKIFINRIPFFILLDCRISGSHRSTRQFWAGGKRHKITL